MNQLTDTIVLHPTLKYWILRKLFIMPIILLGILLKPTMDSYFAVKIIGLVITLLLCFHVIYSYLNTILFTTWEITEEQIRIKKGVFYRSTNFIELYRVYDYEENKNFIEALWGITNIVIHSGDKSSPILSIYGINIQSNIIDTIRKRVEIQKQKKAIYEFTNR